MLNDPDEKSSLKNDSSPLEVQEKEPLDQSMEKKPLDQSVDQPIEEKQPLNAQLLIENECNTKTDVL